MLCMYHSGEEGLGMYYYREGGRAQSWVCTILGEKGRETES